jgi:hypothetical protein
MCGGKTVMYNRLMAQLSEKIEKLTISMEKMELAEYVELVRKPRRLLYINFISGIARGFGMAIGFTILGALLILVLRQVVVLNLPVISDFLAEIVRIVRDKSF